MFTEPLDYTADGFPPRARKLITARQPFWFVIEGEAARQLVPHVQKGRVVDAPSLVVKPKLQVLVGVLMLAEVHALAVSTEVDGERVVVQVGI